MYYKIKQFWVKGLRFAAAALLVPSSYAVAFELKNPLKSESLEELLYLVLNSLVVILFPFVVLLMVYAGFLFVAAQGNPVKLQEARRAILWAAIGGTILLGAKAIALMLEATIKPFLG